MTLHIAALASGKGSNIAAILEAINSGSLDARIAIVLSNNPESPALDRAKKQGIATWARDHRTFASREAFDTAMTEAILASGSDTIVLAGYMRLLSSSFIKTFAGRILNIHPAVLPAFPGAHGVRDALAYGARFSGCTVHFVDEIMDNGPVIIQGTVPISEGMQDADLLQAIQFMEHRIYPQALRWLAQKRLCVNGRHVRILPPKNAGNPQSASSLLTTPEGLPCLISPGLEKEDR